MTEPLAILLYDSLLPGSQLTNRLRDLGYRVRTVTEPQALAEQAAAEMPLVAIVELTSKRGDVCAGIRDLRGNPATAHVPVLAYTDGKDRRTQEEAHAAGANLIVVADGLLAQLPMLLEKVLEVE